MSLVKLQSCIIELFILSLVMLAAFNILSNLVVFLLQFLYLDPTKI